MTTTVEFAVQISCDTCVTKIEDSLKNVEGVKNIQISKDKGTVLVESDLPSTLIQEKIENTGRKAVLKGYGSDGGVKEEFNFVKVEVDSSGCCALCQPDDTIKNKVSKIERGSDDEEELELKYSSDSEDGILVTNINPFNVSDAEDLWIEDDLAAEFDLVDAEDDGSETEEKNILEDGKDEQCKENTDLSSYRSISPLQIDDIDKCDDEKTDKNTPNKKKRKLSLFRKKCLSNLQASKVRKGDFNLSNSNIAFQVLILPTNEEEVLEESEAQSLKNQLLRELFLRTQTDLRNNPESFLLRFADCKFVKPGWLLVHCDNKETFEWLLTWKIPYIEKKQVQIIPALDKTPPQKIKFSINTKWIPDDETMLKLIHLQNRDIDTKRWVLEEKKPTTNGMEQFKFLVDSGSIRALENLSWSFFYEMFTVKIIEFNGNPVNPIFKGKKLRTN